RRFTMRLLTRSPKKNKMGDGPPPARASRIAAAAGSPGPLSAPGPQRAGGAAARADRSAPAVVLGGRSFCLLARRHPWDCCALSVSLITADRFAAAKAAG